MKTDRSQNKYDEIFSDLKKEKMDWSFEEFLAQAETSESTEKPIRERRKTHRWYWAAAAIALLLATGFSLTYFQKNNLAEQEILVRSEILKQKNDLQPTHEIVAVQHKDSVRTVSDSLLTDSLRTTSDEHTLDKILPKRGRMRRLQRPQFASHETRPQPAESGKAGYSANYVIINGQRIENEQEAIDVTKYSFRILSENVSKTVAQTEKVTSFTNDY